MRGGVVGFLFFLLLILSDYYLRERRLLEIVREFY